MTHWSRTTCSRASSGLPAGDHAGQDEGKARGSGGRPGVQDRCAIAKAITKHLVVEDKFTLDVRVESRGAENPSEPTAARTVIELLCDSR